MDDIDVIRKNYRDILSKKRRVLRDEESDQHREIDTLSISPDNFSAIVNKLKNKISVTVSVLCTVKNSLMNGTEYIGILLNSHGALRGLIRELSGHDALKQTAAAGCICNLGLGDAKASLVVAKAAGPYLVAALDNLATELSVTSVWALGNLAGSGHKVSEVLIYQGALVKLIRILESNNEELIDAAEYAILHFVYQMKDELSKELLCEILRICLQSKLTKTSAQIIFIMSCHSAFIDSVSIECLLPQLLHELSLSINYHIENCENIGFCCKLVYIIRILANLKLNSDICYYIINYFLQNSLEKKFVTVMSKDSDVLIDSLIWLLGNLYNFDGNNQFFVNLLK